MVKKLKSKVSGELELSQTKLDVLMFIERYHKEFGFAPAFSEICEATGYKSSGFVFYITESLCKMGFLKKVGAPGQARRIIPTYKQV